MIRLKAAHRGIAFAVPYVAGVAAEPVEMPDGSTVDDAGDRRAEVPDDIRGWFGVDEDGKPTIMGKYFLKISGPFKLADGRIAAVYGADAEPVEGSTVAADDAPSAPETPSPTSSAESPAPRP